MGVLLCVWVSHHQLSLCAHLFKCHQEGTQLIDPELAWWGGKGRLAWCPLGSELHSSRRDIVTSPRSTAGNPIISQYFGPLLLLSLGALQCVVTFSVLAGRAGPILMPLLMNGVTLGKSLDILAFSLQMTPSVSWVTDWPPGLSLLLVNKIPHTQLNIKYHHSCLSLWSIYKRKYW